MILDIVIKLGELKPFAIIQINIIHLNQKYNKTKIIPKIINSKIAAI